MRNQNMFEITVNKQALIERISANRVEHRDVFERAIEGYRTYVQARLEERINMLREGKTIEESFRFAVPQDHTDDYDRVIGMLEMHLDDTITLPEDLYRMYVDNDWDWARNFAIENSGYTQMAGTNYGKFLKPRG